MRDANDPSIVAHQRAALIQRDGDVVDTDGTSSLGFSGANQDSYYISIRHRNHLGVMSADPIEFNLTMPSIDFTQASTATYQLPGSTGSVYAQQSHLGNMRALWPGNLSNAEIGNTHSGNRIIYQGTGSDVEGAYFKVLLDPLNTSVLPNHVVFDYHRADANMDGRVIYQGGNSDADIVFFTIVLFPENTSFLPNYVLFEQIPQ